MEPADTLQALPEHLPRYGHLCKLKHQPTSVTDQTPAYLDESGLHTSQRQVFDDLEQAQPPEEVAQVISQDEQ